MWKWEAKTEKKALQAPWVPRWVNITSCFNSRLPGQGLFKFTRKTILKDVKCWTPNEVRGSSMVELEIEDTLQVF